MIIKIKSPWTKWVELTSYKHDGIGYIVQARRNVHTGRIVTRDIIVDWSGKNKLARINIDRQLKKLLTMEARR